MYKNMTQKGLALGAAVALVSAGFAVPANALGQSDNTQVRLTPVSGTEYTVLSNQYFDLKANMVTGLTGSGALKFLVADTSAAITFDADNDTGTNADVVLPTGTNTITAGAATFTYAHAGAGLTVTYDTASAAPVLAVGTSVTFAGFATSDLAGNGVDATSLNTNFLVTTATNTGTGVIVLSASGLVTADSAATDANANVTLTVNGFQIKDLELATTGIATVETVGANGLVVGDVVTIAGLAETANTVLNGTHKVASISTNVFTFQTALTVAITSDTTIASGAGTVTEPTLGDTLDSRLNIQTAGFGNAVLFDTVTVSTTNSSWPDITAAGRKSGTDGSFVIDTNVNTLTNDKVIRLVSSSATTYSVGVTAWVDDNDNNQIDTTEYASPTRSIQFVAAADLAVTTTFMPTVGAETLSATLSTVPVLNGQQVDAQDAAAVFGALFTRQDSSSADKYAADGDSTWNDTTKLWTSLVSMDLATLAWTGLTQAGGLTAATITHVDGVLTVTTSADHNLRVGDLVDFGASITSSVAATDTALDTGDAGVAVAAITSARIFTVALAGSSTIGGSLAYVVVSFSGNDAITDRVFAGTHTARPYVGTTALAVATTYVVGAAVSASSKIQIAGTSAIQPGLFIAAADANDVEVAKGTTSVPLVVTVYDADGDAVVAGKNVTVDLGNPNGLTKTGTFTINGSAVTSKVLVTDANGQIAITIGENDGDIAAQTRVTVTPEGQSSGASSVDLLWNASTYVLFDLKNNATSSYQAARTVSKNGSYTFDLALLDQWKAAPAAGAYRLKVDNAGNTVSSAYVALSNGRASVTVTDGQIGAGTVIDTDILVEKLNTDGLTYTAQSTISFTDQNSGLGDIAISVATQTNAVVLDIDGSTIYGSATADLSAATAGKATVALDERTTVVTRPSYTANAVVSGRATNSLTNAVRAGEFVTLSGASNILFSDGGVDSFGSITVLANGDGEFGVNLYSNVAMKNTVITVTTANGGSATVKVTFTGVAVTAGTLLVVDAPASVMPGSTFQVVATLTDAYGNPVAVTETADVAVTYTGPGIVFGTLPNTFDAKGQLKFAVLLGTNDKGTGTISVSYDQSSDGDFTGTLLGDIDLVVTKTVTVGAVASAEKVNAGSFLGYVAVYAKGHNGSTISWKIAGKWFKTTITSDYQVFQRKTVAVGMDVNVDIYIDSVKVLSKVVATR